ncbi:hypothetical protein [Paenibacillus xerothermodurans]|nr:hypothetical protein [Paenibacillus xerothermodurans]
MGWKSVAAAFEAVFLSPNKLADYDRGRRRNHLSATFNILAPDI